MTRSNRVLADMPKAEHNFIRFARWKVRGVGTWIACHSGGLPYGMYGHLSRLFGGLAPSGQEGPLQA
jgi:hypothetical protein